MARKKNAQPKRRLDTTSGDDNGNGKKHSKRPTFYFPDRRTTNVIPADDSNHPMLATLPTFLKKFQERIPQMIKEYQEALRKGKVDLNTWYKGFRLITGNRIELKVLSEWLMEEFADKDWNPVQLIQYAQSQAQKDERIINNILENHGQVYFSEWSMIVSSSCQVQTIHIDVPANNYQFGLVLQDNVPGTMVLHQHGVTPKTPEELCSTAWKDAPALLKDCILKNVIVQNRMQQLLHSYGPLLIPRAELESCMVGGDKKPLVPAGLKCGDLICTAGGIPHAGPACQSFRAVVFAAASPTKESLYNVDEQYFAHSVILLAIQVVWDALSSSSSLEDGLELESPSLSSKRWLLQQLAKTVHDYETGPIENHNYVSKAFTKLMHEMAKVYQDEDDHDNDDNVVEESSATTKTQAISGQQTETTNASSTRKPTKDRMEQVISAFLKQNASKSEQELFQYRPNTIRK
ncbi:unnamed protein product [Cylindrotheca closterium]|uniref:Uncharacterized protein n=1 Tax=Cylindrotheca closterium TaxID=2856 RepID=A0AAD2FE69_9STRA|nr:unnamed protein product [Cylindrotheca closterium]